MNSAEASFTADAEAETQRQELPHRGSGASRQRTLQRRATCCGHRLSSDARRKVESLINLGKCFIVEKQYPLARRQFETAVPECKADENQDSFLDLHYTLGRVCEEMKDFKAAINHYQTVLEYDYDYKDNRERLSRLEGGETSEEACRRTGLLARPSAMSFPSGKRKPHEIAQRS